MKTITVHASKQYDILIGSAILAEGIQKLSKMKLGSQIMLISDDIVFPLYGKAVQKQLEQAGFSVRSFVFLAGESSKNLYTYEQVLNALSEASFTRKDTIVALGGGVTGDLAGFAAATYLRGMHFVQIPTSLLAMVDSSVGGKTAVNLPTGKNQVGAFYQPDLVLCDVDFLKTLPEIEYKNGCAEIIKYAMIEENDFFSSIQNVPISTQYEAVIEQAISIKKKYVECDEFDNGKRMLLNFGHTFGHAIEACSNFTLSHGMSVAIGMAMMTKVALQKGLCTPLVYGELIGLLKQYQLPLETNLTKEELYDFCLKDKKGMDQTISLIVPRDVGKCTIEKIQKEELLSFLSLGGAK